MTSYPEEIVSWSDPARSAGPLRQLPTDAMNEAHVATLVEGQTGWSLHRYASPFAQIDYQAIHRHDLVAHVEIRCRTRASGDSDWFSIATDKYHALFSHWLAFHVPSLYVVAFADCVRWLNVAEINQYRRPRWDASQAVTKGRSAGVAFVDVDMVSLHPLEEL